MQRLLYVWVVACRVPPLSNAFSGGKTIVLDGRRINIVCNDGFFYPGSSQTSYVAVCHSTGTFTPRLLDCRGFSGGKRKTDFQLTVKRLFIRKQIVRNANYPNNAYKKSLEDDIYEQKTVQSRKKQFFNMQLNLIVKMASNIKKLFEKWMITILLSTVINKSLRPSCFFRINRKQTIFSVHTFHLFESFLISITSLVQQSLFGLIL